MYKRSVAKVSRYLYIKLELSTLVHLDVHYNA